MKRIHKQIKKSLHIDARKRDLSVLFFLPVLLTVVGLFFIFEASSVSAFREYGDSFYFFKQQAMWAVIGAAVMSGVSFIPYKIWYKLATPFMGIALLFLVLVLFPGVGTKVGGARRWINLGFMSFQPSELVKFSVLLYLSSWFVHKEKKRLPPFLLLLLFVVGLVMAQPDLGTTLVITSIFLIVYFVSGDPLFPLISLAPFGLTGLGLLIMSSPYRMARLLSFLHPEKDPQGINYHVNQILISLAGGGIFGRGFSESRQKYQFLPEAHTDSIFAIIGEEIGFLGSVGVLVIYVMLFSVIARVAVRAKNRYGMMLATGVFAGLCVQVVINLSGMTALLPLTGVPLPFLSYGGSSLVIFFAMMGIVINIKRNE